MIAIIGFLAALLLPALHRAKIKAHQVACLSNQRQIALHFRLRLDDASQRLDQVDDPTDISGGWYDFFLGLPERVWLCPRAPKPGRPGSYWNVAGGVQTAWTGYWPTNQPLPGAVNVSSFDGHGELVKLDRLWQLYWHKDYQPPAKRPGLPGTLSCG